MSARVLKTLAMLVCIGAAATITVLFLKLANGNGVPTVFPPTAMAICLALNSPRRWWPALMVASGVSITLGNVVGGLDPFYSAAYASADIVQAIVVYLLLTRGIETKPPLLTRADLFRLVRICLAAALLSGFLGTIIDYVLLPQPRSYSFTFGFGISLVTNLLIVPLGMDQDLSVRGRRILRGTAIFGVGGLALMSLYGSGGTPNITPLVAMQLFLFVASIATILMMISLGGERRATARALAQETGVTRLIESAEGAAFIAFDPEGRVNFFSRGAERILGYRQEEVLGHISPFMIDPEQVAARAAQLGIEPGFGVFVHTLEQGAPYETREWTYICKDGTRKTLSASMTKVREIGVGEPGGYLAIVRDLTEWRRVEDSLREALGREREANLMMREATQAKTDFVNNVSHELRTPLSSIMGYLEVLEDEMAGPVTSDQRDLLGRIDRNSRRLMSLIQDLLTLGEIDTGELPMRVSLVDLGDVIEEAVTHAIVQAIGETAPIDVSLPGTPVYVEADRDHVFRMMLDLLSNALKFTPADGDVRVTLESRTECAVVRVEDTGAGIHPDEQPHVLQRFFRSRSARDGEAPGTGLGLSIVDGIAQAHAGSVTLDSQPSMGSTFTLTLPKSQTIKPPDTTLNA